MGSWKLEGFICDGEPEVCGIKWLHQRTMIGFDPAGACVIVLASIGGAVDE